MPDKATNRRLMAAGLARQAMEDAGVAPEHIRAVDLLINAHRRVSHQIVAVRRTNLPAKITDGWEEREAQSHG